MSHLNQLDLRATLTFMAENGGDFIKKLAEAWLAADAENSERLHTAFRDVLMRFHGYQAKHEELTAKLRSER